jgi:hypothetical protein
MAQPLTEALAESARAAAKADDLERDRVAWNLPRSKVDANARRSERSEPDASEPHEPSEPRR